MPKWWRWTCNIILLSDRRYKSSEETITNARDSNVLILGLVLARGTTQKLLRALAAAQHPAIRCIWTSIPPRASPALHTAACLAASHTTGTSSPLKSENSHPGKDPSASDLEVLPLTVLQRIWLGCYNPTASQDNLFFQNFGTWGLPTFHLTPFDGLILCKFVSSLSQPI